MIESTKKCTVHIVQEIITCTFVTGKAGMNQLASWHPFLGEIRCVVRELSGDLFNKTSGLVLCVDSLC